MGTIFGKVSVAEPAFDVLLTRNAQTSYEVRRYGERFAIEAAYDGTDDGTPFRLLAGYIGVFGKPQNDGGETIAMTAPVISENKSNGKKIAMTAPVVSKEDTEGTKKVMQFILPAEYDDIDKIPKPTNPAVKIKEVPPATGVVHRYNGNFEDSRCKIMATALTQQLKEDGLKISEEDALDRHQCWGYNPPWTIPALKRNEVWIELSDEQVHDILNIFGEESEITKN